MARGSIGRLLLSRLLLTCSACLVPVSASAHALAATPYVLPVPFWLYVYACAAVLVVTFGVLGYFSTTPALPADSASRVTPTPARVVYRGLWPFAVLRLGAVGCLLVVLVAGLLGTGDPGRNINTLLFWVVFLLGFAYLSIFIGDVYSIINPWRVIADWLERLGIDLSTQRVRYPEALGYWPAFVFYLMLIWLELFELPRPSLLSSVLVLYTAITIVGVFLIGKETWFRRCDVFGVFLRLIAALAPVGYARAAEGSSWLVRVRSPLAGARAVFSDADLSLVLIVLFMLSSTTYDAIYRTILWTGLFWRPMLWAFQPLWGSDLAKAQSLLEGWFVVYQRGSLLLSPFFYLMFYWVALWCARVFARSTIPLRQLARDFAYALIPIGVAYNVTHYYPLLIVEMRSLLWRASDPLGWGWNLLDRLPPVVDSPGLDMGVVWHTQVLLIVVGHFAGACLAHMVAMRIFPTRKQVVLSQLPLLVLMVGLTVVGLWILSLPLAG